MNFFNFSSYNSHFIDFFSGILFLVKENILENYLIFAFLPLILGLLFLLIIIKRKIKNEFVNNIIIILISFFLIGSLDIKSLIILVTLSTIVYWSIIKRLHYRQYLLLIAVSLLVALIGIKIILSSLDKPIILLGFSYYFFRLGSVVIEIGRENDQYKNISAHRFFAFVLFFPIFLAGPVQRLHNFLPCNISFREIKTIILNIILLLVFKFLFIDIFLLQLILIPTRTILLPEILNLNYFLRNILLLFHGASSLLHGYLDLVIYTRLAISLGRLFGYKIMEDFNKPYLATNISDYWRRWHISITTWARDYIYFPIILKIKKPWLATYATMLTIGLWHSANLNWVIFALCHGTAINLYSIMSKNKNFINLENDKYGSIFLKTFGWICTIIFVCYVYNLVALTDYSKSLEILTSSLLN